MFKHPKDQRKHKRFRTRSPIAIKLLDGSLIKSVERVHDISKGGLCFSCRDYVRPNLLLQVVIKDKKGTMELTARVVRVNAGTFYQSTSEVGVVFVNVTEEQVKRLKQLPKKGLFG